MALNHKKAAAAALPSRTSYRDDPDAVSMHTTRSDYDYEDVPQLPSYSDSEAAEAYQPATEYTQQRPHSEDDYRRIPAPANNWGSNQNPCPSLSIAIGSETSIRMDARLLDPANLHAYVVDYLRNVPPKPFVRVQGWHWQTKTENKKTERRKTYDFDVVLGLEKFLPSRNRGDRWSHAASVENGDKVHRGGWRKTRAPGSTQDIQVGTQPKWELMAWCEDFCASKSALKIFRVERSITGLDTEGLREQLTGLVRSTHYRGHVDVSFPMADRYVDVYTPHWANRARISWVRWVFYLTFLWLFTWPVLLFMTKRWSVYRVEWRWSIGSGDANQQSRREHASVSEADWLKTHANLIRSLVLDKFHGDGTDLPVDVDVEAAMSRASGRLPQSGNANVDAAVNFLHGSVGAWNALNGRGSRNSGGGWGMDS